MALNIDTKFEGKVTLAFKNDTKNLGNVYRSTWKSQHLDFDGVHLFKVENVWAYNSQGSYEIEERCKIEKDLTYSKPT